MELFVAMVVRYVDFSLGFGFFETERIFLESRTLIPRLCHEAALWFGVGGASKCACRPPTPLS